MFPRALIGAVVLAGVGALPALTAADETKKDDKKEDGKPKLVAAGVLNGTIAKVANGGKTLTLRIYGRVPAGIQSTYGLRRLQYKDVHEDIELTLADEAKIRIPPEQEFDEKGRPKKTVIKKDPADPDRNLPGVKGAPTDLHINQIVQLTLGRTREKQPQARVMMVVVLGVKE